MLLLADLSRSYQNTYTSPTQCISPGNQRSAPHQGYEMITTRPGNQHDLYYIYKFPPRLANWSLPLPTLYSPANEAPSPVRRRFILRNIIYVRLNCVYSTVKACSAIQCILWGRRETGTNWARLLHLITSNAANCQRDFKPSPLQPQYNTTLFNRIIPI